MPMHKQSRSPAGSIREDGRYPIDLTGPHSHTLVLKPGVGSLSIGPSQSGNKTDLHVDPYTPINWNVFDSFATPAGSPWPRVLYYTGSDVGFFDWAKERPIEQMSWVPILPKDIVVDASHSKLHDLHIELDQFDSLLHLNLPKTQVFEYFRLSVAGNLSRFSVDGDMPYSLTLKPRTSRRKNNDPFLLPDLGELHQVTSLTLRNEPLAQPISLECLSRFQNLTSLSLWGNFCDLDLLARQTQLTNLELRFMPDLGDLPPLNVWPLLDRFIAFNVEEITGKRLRQQMKARANTRPWTGYASVSQLRKSEWWTTEFGRPFSSWPKRLAKLANEAYDVAQAALAQARSLADAEAAITAFTVRFNTLKGIETIEREDLGEAVWQLSQSDHQIGQPITEETAQRWFDAARDY
ncbi:hypothetical protein [Brevibacillus brevis]|uniref:Uncharacterized protein n=1 Tax=Brevibacillus brevis TaxID=1393 RepID=A0A517IGK9_BREBE|nr:hypothetical protein [Brevibacillus brevis]QDS38025.1 hypothetical protein FPS98_02920 [Brevibacillus brevis]